MKKLLVFFIIAGFLPIWSMQETAQVGTYAFNKEGKTWLMTGLPEDYECEEEYSCTFEDDTWDMWYDSGDEMLIQILDLGSNIVFKMKSSVDGLEHIFCVTEDDVVGIWPGMSNATKIGLGLGAGGAGVAILIIDNACDDDEASKTKR